MKGFYNKKPSLATVQGFLLEKYYTADAIREDDSYYVFKNKYCPNCFTIDTCWTDSPNRKPEEITTFSCFKCHCFSGVKDLLLVLPNDWEIKQQKALKRKELQDEISQYEDDIEAIEKDIKRLE